MLDKLKSQSKLNFILSVVFFAALIITVIVAVLAYEENEVYRNERQFLKFVEYKQGSDNISELMSGEKVKYNYGEPVSYALNYSDYHDEKIELFRDEIINGIIEEYSNNVSDERVRALIVESNIYESSSGAVSLIIHESSSIENNKMMENGHSEIHTYRFSKKTGDALVPNQVFYEGYRDYCYEYFADYFIKNYNEELNDGWHEYIQPTEENFNEFAVTDKGVVFFFEEGTILDESKGIVSAGLAGAHSETVLRDRIIQRYIDPSKPMVALTYDDGPGLDAEDRILDCLEENNAVATFFYQGVFIEGREEKIRRALELGCEIGHHTWSHPVLTSLDAKDVKRQFDKTNEAIYDACGQYPTVFRPSYGMTDSEINKMSGLPVIMWDVDTLDWESRNGKKVHNVIKRAKKSGRLDGSIILMHSIHDSTADATELIIPWLKENGYQIVTVSELIKYKSGEDPVAGKVYDGY